MIALAVVRIAESLGRLTSTYATKQLATRRQSFSEASSECSNGKRSLVGLTQRRPSLSRRVLRLLACSNEE